MERAPTTMDIADLAPIGRDEMVGLARIEYERLVDLLRDLPPEEWDRPTACDEWTVRLMVAHLLGAAEGNASPLENGRQLVRGALRVRGTGRPLIDGINAVQVDDRRHLGATDLLDRLEAVSERAVRGRHRMPGPLRRIAVPDPIEGRLTLGKLVDVIYTRDEWMHRVDLSRATGRQPILTAAQDGRIVADVVRDWGRAHRAPVTLELTGPAGGTYRQGGSGPVLTLDAVDFCLAVSGRTPAEGLLAVPVLF
jgi:uncharacterized protein (TIGR03083 family)